MRIGIDACCWANRRGFGRYTRELVTSMVSERRNHDFILVTDRITAGDYSFPAGATVEAVYTKEQPTRSASATSFRGPADLLRMSRAVSRIKPDVFFFPAVYSYYPVFGGIPTAITFHDAIAENHPGLIFPGLKSRFLWNIKTRLALRRADTLLTVSNTARRQIASAFNYPESKIHVALEGVAPSFRPIDDRNAILDSLRRYGIPEKDPLILYVGGISPHKNLDGLLNALAILRRTSGIPWRLALVGDYLDDGFYGCHEEISSLSRTLRLEERVIFTGFVHNDDLAPLYNAATVFVTPSLDEGFCLPAVEAMACGTPVAASSRGALPEVIQSAGLFFEPTDHDEMAAVLLRLLSDPSLREKLSSDGLRQAKLYSWKKTARRVVGLLEDMKREAAGKA